MTDITQSLQDVFREVFDDEEIVITDDMTSENIEEWDSMMHINLIFACEQKFGLKFALAEIASLRNVGELKAIITSKSTT